MMNICKKEVTKLVLSGLKDLDPITVFLEQNGQAGMVTFVCWGKAGSAFFGAMGCDLIPFLASCNADYIARKMVEGEISEIDYDEVRKKTGVEDICRETAYVYSDELTEAYGCEWMLDLPTKTTEEFSYVKLICEQVIAACKESPELMAA